MATQAKSTTKQSPTRSRTSKTSPQANVVQLLDSQGNIQLEALSQGMFTLRFAPDLKRLTMTWVPDGKGGDQPQKQFEIPPDDGTGGALSDFGGCIQQQSYNSIGDLFVGIASCVPQVFS